LLPALALPPTFASDDWMHFHWLAQAGTNHTDCFLDLLSRLDEPHRHYHTRYHIASLLKLASDHERLIQNPHDVNWAIWYHDAVYDPKSSNNERESAELANVHLTRMGVNGNSLEQVNQLIMATQSHRLPEGTHNTDCALFLDLDLSVLASDPQQYQKYASAIRKEFSMFPKFLYNPGRRKVLLSFLDKDRIFLTDVFHAQWDAKARENLTWELNQL
jgi:predicted metal-dependent HD superfamily phosphohydrolase